MKAPDHQFCCPLILGCRSHAGDETGTFPHARSPLSLSLSLSFHLPSPDHRSINFNTILNSVPTLLSSLLELLSTQKWRKRRSVTFSIARTIIYSLWQILRLDRKWLRGKSRRGHRLAPPNNSAKTRGTRSEERDHGTSVPTRLRGLWLATVCCWLLLHTVCRIPRNSRWEIETSRGPNEW